MHDHHEAGPTILDPGQLKAEGLDAEVSLPVCPRRRLRAISIWVAAVAIIGLIEAGIWVFSPSNRADRTNFLRLDFANGETVQRAEAFKKLHDLTDLPTDFLQVGDSSGMHGVVPSVIQEQLNNSRYLNMNVATTLGYIGYYNIAKYTLERQNTPGSIKYLVLYTNLFGGTPRSLLWDDKTLIGHDIKKEFGSPFYSLFQIPSLGLRQSASRNIMYLGGLLKRNDSPLADNEGYFAFEQIYRDSRGWVREHDVPGDVPADIWRNLRALTSGQRPDNMPPEMFRALTKNVPRIQVESFFDWSRMRQVTYMEHIYGLFYDLAKAHGAKLLVVFNPLPQSAKDLIHRVNANGVDEGLLYEQEILEELKRMQGLYPDAYFQTDLDFWPDNRFSVFSHIETPYAVRSTETLARRLRAAIPELAAAPAPNPGFPRRVSMDLGTVYSGYGWIRDKQADGSVLPFIGPRDLGAIWAAVDPTGDYRLRVNVSHAKDHAIEQLSVVVNEELVIGKRLLDNGTQVEWIIPAKVVRKWNGWLMLTFTTRAKVDVPNLWDASVPLSEGRSIAITALDLRTSDSMAESSGQPRR